MRESLAEEAARRNAGSGREQASMQAWVSGRRTTACDPHALGGDQCGEQRNRP